MTQALVEAMPVWKQLARYLRAEDSVLLHASRYHPIRPLLDGVGRFYTTSAPVRCVMLGPTPGRSGTMLDYSEFWSATQQGLAVSVKCSVSNVFSYKAAVRKLLQRCPERALVVLETSEHQLPDEHAVLLATFNELLREFSQPGKLQVVATDDYALRLPSPLPFFKEIHFGHLDIEVVGQCIEHISRTKVWNMSEANLHDLARRVHAETGGHPGLFSSALEKLEQDGLDTNTAGTLDGVRQHLESDDTVDRIVKALGADPYDLCRTALKFETPERASPADRMSAFLLQLGVLRRYPLGKLELYPGLITRLIKEMAGSPP